MRGELENRHIAALMPGEYGSCSRIKKQKKKKNPHAMQEV
jgi:hypothetical protein